MYSRPIRRFSHTNFLLTRLVVSSCALLLTSTLLAAPAPSETAFSPLAQLAEHPERSAPATAVSLNQSTLSARIQASVESIQVGVSEQVSAGSVLLKLDCTDYQLALQQAQAGVTIAEARLQLANNQKQRASQLLARDLTSRENADTTATDAIARQAELTQAQIAVRQARVNVERCVIKAPFAGIVTARLASEGQLATVGTPLIAMVDTQHLELSAQIGPSQLTQLQQASQLQFVADQAYPVTLLRSGGVINSETRDQEIRLAFNGPRPAPGSAGKLQWQDPRWFVPARYIVSRDGQLGIFLAQQNKAHFMPLPTAVPGRAAAVELPADSLIITRDLGRLQAGDPLP